MDKLEPPKSLILTENLAENWRRFKQQFEIYQIASGLDKKDGKADIPTSEPSKPGHFLIFPGKSI